MILFCAKMVKRACVWLDSVSRRVDAKERQTSPNSRARQIIPNFQKDVYIPFYTVK